MGAIGHYSALYLNTVLYVELKKTLGYPECFYSSGSLISRRPKNL